LDRAAPNAVFENVPDRPDNIRNSEIDAVGMSIPMAIDQLNLLTREDFVM